MSWLEDFFKSDWFTALTGIPNFQVGDSDDENANWFQNLIYKLPGGKQAEHYFYDTSPMFGLGKVLENVLPKDQWLNENGNYENLVNQGAGYTGLAYLLAEGAGALFEGAGGGAGGVTAPEASPEIGSIIGEDGTVSYMTADGQIATESMAHPEGSYMSESGVEANPYDASPASTSRLNRMPRQQSEEPDQQKQSKVGELMNMNQRSSSMETLAATGMLQKILDEVWKNKPPYSYLR